MASYEDVDFPTLDSFHKPFYDGSMCNRDVVLSEKLPPDKVKVRLLNTAAYLVTFICILISTFFNNDPVHKSEFDVPMMEYNYASQVFMNATEDFIASTSKH